MSQNVYSSPWGRRGEKDLKPCLECVKKFGKGVCSHNGCCVLEDVPGVSPEKLLGNLNEDWVGNR